MKVAITGISSYLASAIVPLLEIDGTINEILGIDIVEPKYPIPLHKVVFKKCDVRDPKLAEYLKGYDALLHLAFIVSPLKNSKEMYSINVDGSKNVFNCAISAGIKKIIHASSVAAYGAFPENPVPITEDYPIRAMPSKFYYNETKFLVEKYLDELEQKFPNIIITRIRPHIFLGPNINNLFRNSFKGKKSFGFFPDSLSQYVWVDDVAQAFYLALIKDAPGAFNIGGDNPLPSVELAKCLNKKYVKIPYKLALFVVEFIYRTHINRKADPGWLRCARYPIIVDSSKAKKMLGWAPKYDTIGTILAFIAYRDAIEKNKAQ